MRKKIIREKNIFIFIILIFCCLINLYGCFSYTLRAESIVIDETTVPDEITIDDFNLSEIKLLVTRVDGTVDSVSVTEDMLSNESLKKLETSGVHNLYVRYDGKLTILTVNLVKKYSNVTITFETNGGNKISSQSIEKKSKAFRPINPTKEGYIFSGWYLDKNFTKEFLFSSIIYEDITLYAKWTEVINVIKYNTDGSSEIDDSKVKTGEKLYKVTPAEKEGYKFIGWYLDEEHTIEYDYDAIVNKSFTLYAKWEANKCKVIFKCNGGSSIKAKDVDYNEKLSKDLVPTKEGYRFEGWYLDEGLTIKFDFDSLITEDITLYAKWVGADYKVEFETNGGSSIDSIYINHGDTVKENIITTRSDAVFLGWYLDKDLTIEFNRNDKITEDIVLYAKWQMNDIVVSFETDGGTKIESQIIKYGNKATLPENPKKIGYIFVGWCTDKNKNVEFDFEKDLDSDTVIYAKWMFDTSSKNKYSVVIKDGEMNVLDSFKVEEGSTLIELVPIEMDSKIFVNWYTDSSMQIEFDLNTKLYSNIELYAKYVDAYVVEFLDKNGNTIASQKVGEGMDAIPPKAPEVKGYEFARWDKDLTNVRSNITTKAIYTTYKYEVKFVVNGNIVSSQKVSNGEVPTEPSDFDEYIDTGYHFKCWDKEISNTYQDTIYIATLEKNIYIVNFVDYYGNVYFSTSVKYGDVVEKPNKTMNDYYEVSNWYEDKTFNKIFDFEKSIKEETTIYCEFDFNDRVVYIENNNDIIINSLDLKNIKVLNIPKNLNSKKVTLVNEFSNFDDVTKIIINENLKKIDLEKINKFKNLKEIIVSENDYYESLDGVLYDKEMKKLLLYPRGKLEEKFIVPSSVLSIGDNAFCENEKLVYIDLSNVNEIGKCAFSNTKILSFIINKDNIVKEDDSFKDCNLSLRIIVNKEYYLNYQLIWLDMKDNIYSTEFMYEHYLYQIVNNEIEIIEYLGSEKYIEIPASINGMNVVSINSYAFNSNYDLKGITLPNTIKNISDNSFLNLDLEYIKINSLIEISNDYLIDLKNMLKKTNIYVLDNLYNDYCLKFERIYKTSQIYEDYAYIMKDGSYGLLQYFGEEQEITIPKKYKNTNVSFIDENFIISKDVISITVFGMVNIESMNINKETFFLVDDEYLESYLEYDYAFYSNRMDVKSDLRYLYGELDGIITIIKVTSKFEDFVVPDYVNNKKVVYIGRYSMIGNENVMNIEVGENIIEIGKNGLKTKNENELKIVFKSEYAPKIEKNICYESDQIYKISFEQKEYGERFADYNVYTLNSIIKENEDYKYCILNGKVSIIEYLGKAKEVIIPDKIDGYEVVSIEPFAFKEKVTVVKVTIPNTVLTIGYLAFDDMRKLEEIIIDSKKVIYIEKKIVQKPIKIRVDDSLLYRYRNSEIWSMQEVIAKSSEVIDGEKFQYVIEDNEAIIIKVNQYDYNLLFKNDSLGKYKIKRLGAYSFYDTDITKITIYYQIDEIGYNAFPESLTCLSLYDSLPPKLEEQESNFEVKISKEYYELFKRTSWSKYNISDTYSEKNSNSEFEYLINRDGITITKYIGNSLDVVIPNEIDNNKVIAIGDSAFKETSLKSIKFGENIEKVYDFAFYNCTNLENIEFSSNITYIGEKALDNTKWLKDNSNSLIIIGQVLYKYNGKYKLDTKITVPEGIISITPYAFESEIGITEVVLPITLKTIGKGVFKDCVNLVKVELSKGIERIEEETFKNCSRLKTVLLNKNLTQIGKNAFENCLMLSEFDFYNVEAIEDNAFSGCEKLNKVELPQSITELGKNVFSGCILLSEIKIDNGASYKIIDGILYDSTKTILYEDLLKNQRREITIPSTVTLIKENAFASSLVEKVIISNKLTIENSVFVENKYLVAVVFTTSIIPTISETSFENGTELYFTDKILNEIKKDYLYEKYIVHSILEFSQTKYDMKVGDEIKLVPICPLNYNASDITFVSNNEKILTIDNGKIKAISVGKVNIIVNLNLQEVHTTIIEVNIEK